MKKLLCILILFVAINVCASESMDTHSYTTRLKSGAIKRKDMSDDQELLDWQEYEEADSKQPEPKKFKPMPSTPPLTATTTTQEPSEIDLLKERLENLSPKTEHSSTIEPVQTIVTMAADITTKLTQRVETLEKQREDDKKQLIVLIEKFNQIIEFMINPSKASPERVSQTSCDYQIFKHEASAAMILDFGLGEIGLDQ